MTALLTSYDLLFVCAAENGLVTGRLDGRLLWSSITRLVLAVLAILRLLAIWLLRTVGCLILVLGLRHILRLCLRGVLHLRHVLSLRWVLSLRRILSLRQILSLGWILSLRILPLRWILLILILKRRISRILTAIRRLSSIRGLRGIASLCGRLAVVGLGV